MPAWEGAPARLVEAIVGVALLIWISEILGTFGLLYAGTLVARLRSCSARRHVALLPAGGAGAGDPRGADGGSAEHRGGCRTDRTRRPESVWSLLVMVGVIAARRSATGR